MKKRMPQLSAGIDSRFLSSTWDQESVSSLMRALQSAGVTRISVNLEQLDSESAKKLRASSLLPFGVDCFGAKPKIGAALRLRPDWILLDNQGGLAALKRNLAAAREGRVRTVVGIQATRQELDHALRLKADEIQITVSRAINSAARERLVQLALRARKSSTSVSLSGALKPDVIRALAQTDVFDMFHVDFFKFSRAWLVGAERAARELVAAVQAP